ncbi:hypothetical protein AAVH_32202 [Aphelenchoides avenae]|nr:hypothetical protein AAVH_32202 [Aphelenchus avenae]
MANKGWRWQYFSSRRETRDGQPVVVARCKFCAKEYFGRELCNIRSMDEHLLKKCKQMPRKERAKLVQYANRDNEDDPPYHTLQGTVEKRPLQSAKKPIAGVGHNVGNRTKNLYVWTYFARFVTSKMCLICGTRMAGSYPNNTATIHLEGRHGVSGDKHKAESDKISGKLKEQGIDLEARRREATEAEKKRVKSIAAGIDCDEASLPWNSWKPQRSATAPKPQLSAMAPKPQRSAMAPKPQRSAMIPKPQQSLPKKTPGRDCEGRHIRRGLSTKSAVREPESRGIRQWLSDASSKRKRERSPEVDDASLTTEEKIAKLELGIREDKERLKILQAELSQLELEEARMNDRHLQRSFASGSDNDAGNRHDAKNAQPAQAGGIKHEIEGLNRVFAPP